MKKDFVPILVTAIILVILIVIWYHFPNYINDYLTVGTAQPLTQKERWERNSAFGDTYGVLNALLSIFTTAGLIYTLITQQIQLNLQRKEFSSQREELELQREEMKATRKEFVINRSTSIVYSQLEKFNDSISRFKIEDGTTIYQGNEAFLFLESIILNFRTPFDQLDNEDLTLLPTLLDNQILPEHLLEPKNIRNNIKIKEIIDEITAVMNIFVKNKKVITDFALSASKNCSVVKDVLVNSQLQVDEFRNLHMIYVRNLGRVYYNVFQFIRDRNKELDRLYEKYPNLFDKSIRSSTHFFLFKYPSEKFANFFIASIDTYSIENIKKVWQFDLEIFSDDLFEF